VTRARALAGPSGGPRLPRAFRLALLALLALLGAAPLAAQAPVIDSVVILRDDVFDEGEFGVVGRTMRALHITTREHVVRRELLLAPGVPYDSALVAETERNLRRLGVFRRVRIDTLRVDDRLVLRVLTQDGWSSRLIFDINVAAGQTSFALGVAESNVLGMGGSGGLRYRSTPDRTSWLMAYRQPRLIADRVGVTAQLDLRSDGRSIFGAVGQPFLSLSSRWSYGVDGTEFDGDVLRFRDGNPTPVETLRRRYALVRAEGAHALSASPRGYLRVGVLGQVRRDDFVPQPIAGQPFPRTWTAAVGPYVEWSRARFAVVRNTESFLREEDQSISLTLRLGVLAAPRAFGYERDGAGFALSGSAGARIPKGLLRFDGGLSALVDEAGLDSSTATIRGRVLLQPSPRHSLIAGGFMGWQENQLPGAEFDIGLSYGLRAYPLHAFTGDRAWLAGAEYRFTVADDLWRVLGVALGAFAEAGGAWFDGDARRTGANVGLGIRVGPSRLASGDMFRVDAAYRFEGAGFEPGWSLVLGRGLSF
jgi:hypothetical protein